MKRRIDPRLFHANAAGALNGHVPITAINSCILTMCAFLQGCSWVVFANEFGSDEETMEYNGHPVNHQYSKSADWEKWYRSVMAEIFSPGFEYFSILRPVSELWIANELSKDRQALSLFRSCNKNFAIEKKCSADRWCTKCPKCAFTFLMLAARS